MSLDKPSPKGPTITYLDAAWIAVVGLAIGMGTTQFWYTRESRIIDSFHRIYWQNQHQTWLGGTFWRGVQVLKFPTDLWVYQHLIHETKPDLIIETGTFRGGSAYYFASLFDLMNHGRVLTIDIQEWPGRPNHERIEYVIGSSTATAVLERVREEIRPGERVMVVLDSDHRRDHVLEELRLYAPLVTVGNYLVVEDTQLNGHPVYESNLQRGPGPMEALEDFMKENASFEPDESHERFLLTGNPRGWLRRVR